MREAAPPALMEHDSYVLADMPDEDEFNPVLDLVMRVSTVASADLCPGRVWWRSAPGYEDTPTPDMVWGSIVHALIEHQVLSPDDTLGASLTRQIARRVEMEEGLDFLIEDDMMGGDRYAAWVDEALGLATEWRTWARRHLGFPIGGGLAERRMMAPLCYLADGGRVWLAGTADLILPGNGLGLDWKTANKGWPASRAAAQNQQHAYRFLAQEVYGVELDEWWFVVGNRAKGTWEHYEVPASDDAMDGFLYRAEALAKMLLAGTPTFNPKGESGRRAWWCSPTYCNAWGLCTARCLGDEKDRLPRPSSTDSWGNLT